MPNGCACAIEVEDRRLIQLRLDLRRVSQRRHRPSCRGRQRRGAPDLSQLVREDTCGERLRCWIGRFEDHQPQATEGGLDEASERLGDAGAWPIGLAQGGQERFGEGRGGEHCGELGDCLLDAFVEGQSRDRKVTGALRRRQRDGTRMERRVEHRTSAQSLPSRDPRHPPRRSARRARGVRWRCDGPAGRR